METERKNTLPVREAYEFARNNGLSKQADEIRELDIEWDRNPNYNTKVRRGYLIRLFEKNEIYDTFVSQCWPNGSTTDGLTRRNRCVQYSEKYDDFLAGNFTNDEVESEGVAIESFEFALEAHLRDFLAKNLNQIEPGLQLYRADEKLGVEYAIDGGRIDILATDISGKFVAIELKLSQGRNKALGQLLYYMGWIDLHLGEVPCRGIIIASDISNELLVAVSRVPGVTICRYKMDFSIERLDEI